MTSNAEIVLEAIRAVEERDVDRLFGLYHDDVEFHDAESLPYGGSARGKQHLLRQFEEHPEQTWLGTWGPLQPTEAERRMDPEVIGEQWRRGHRALHPARGQPRAASASRPP